MSWSNLSHALIRDSSGSSCDLVMLTLKLYLDNAFNLPDMLWVETWNVGG
eukprot:c34966_g1_i1 orf=82-231(+)